MEPSTEPKQSRLAKAPAFVRRLVDLYIDMVVYLANSLVNKVPNHWFRLFFYRRFMRWTIGRSTSIHKGCKVVAFPKRGTVTIGDNTVIGQDFFLGGPGCPNMSITIGNNVNIAMQVFVTLGGHNLDPRGDFELSGEPHHIDDHAVIFARAMIIRANVGRGAVVLPGAVVVKDVEPFTIVGGNPAKVIGMREPREDPHYRLNWRWRFH